MHQPNRERGCVLLVASGVHVVSAGSSKSDALVSVKNVTESTSDLQSVEESQGPSRVG